MKTFTLIFRRQPFSLFSVFIPEQQELLFNLHEIVKNALFSAQYFRIEFLSHPIASH
jgi:hypothetical protein